MADPIPVTVLDLDPSVAVSDTDVIAVRQDGDIVDTKLSFAGIKTWILSWLPKSEPTIQFFNDTGVDIPKGTPINAAGTNAANKILKGVVADANDPQLSSAVIGLTIAIVPNQTVGHTSKTTRLTDVDTDGLTIFGPTYLKGGGGKTKTRPTFPATILILGTAIEMDASSGVFQCDLSRFRRRASGKSYGFTSQGVGSGKFYKGGFYEWASTAITIDEGGGVNHGTIGRTYSAHACIVAAGAGVVTGGGQVGLRVVGIRDDDTDVQSAGHTSIITDDIETLTVNKMKETADKFSGQVLYELYVVNGTPSSYSLTMNYGYSKYEDFQNRDVTVTGLECVWQGNAADATFDIALKHHTQIGWNFAASGFIAGNGDIARRSVSQQLAPNVVNGFDGSWKVVDINKFIDSNGPEGILFEIDTGSANTIQTMDMHVAAVSEELTI